MLWVVLRGIEAVEHDTLIADDAGGAIHWGGIDTPRIHAFFGAGDKEGARLMHYEQSLVIEMAAVNHIETSSFDGKNIQQLTSCSLPELM